MPRSLFAFLLIAPLATGCLEDDLGRSPSAETDAKVPGGRTAPNGPSDPACDWRAGRAPDYSFQYCMPQCPEISDGGRYLGLAACTADTEGECLIFDSIYECRAGRWEKLYDFGWHEDGGAEPDPYERCPWDGHPNCDEPDVGYFDYCRGENGWEVCADASPSAAPDAGGSVSCPAPPGHCDGEDGMCVDQGAPSPDWCDAGVPAPPDGDVGAPDDLDLGAPVADGDVRECPAPPGWCTYNDGTAFCVDQGPPAARWCDAGPTP